MNKLKELKIEKEELEIEKEKIQIWIEIIALVGSVIALIVTTLTQLGIIKYEKASEALTPITTNYLLIFWYLILIALIIFLSYRLIKRKK